MNPVELRMGVLVDDFQSRQNVARGHFQICSRKGEDPGLIGLVSVRHIAIVAFFLASTIEVSRAANTVSLIDAVQRTQPKMVKIFGSGGIARLEGYQSGFLVSGQGHVLTVWSYVLDEVTSVVLADGSRFDASLVNTDPRTEIALLKIDYDGEDLPHFRLAESVQLEPGSRVLAFSNLFRVATGDEPVSVQHGVVAAIAPIASRFDRAKSRFQGNLYILDAITNNPGAAGGALTDHEGRLAGMLGKEHRDLETNAWLNYALPAAAFTDQIQEMLAGRFVMSDLPDEGPKPDRPLTAAALGLVLVPDVVTQTPPYIDSIRPNSPAAKAGIQPDDLIVYVEDQLISSCRALRDTLARYEFDTPVRIIMIRGDELIERTLSLNQ